MRGRTQEVKTHKHTKFDRIAIEGKDPDCDYSFQRQALVSQGGGVTNEQWEAVGPANHSGERWGGPKVFKHRQGVKQFINEDTILCKRPKEVSSFFKREENEKRNSQIKFIRSVANRAQNQLRELDPGSIVVDKSQGVDYTQTVGPTEEE